MADAPQIIQANDKGAFQVPIARSQIQRIDIIDIDIVVEAQGGQRLILPGAALGAVSAAPPAISFADGSINAGDLIQQVGKVETPTVSIPAMTSLTQFDQKLTNGNKNLTPDEAQKESQAQQEQQQKQSQADVPTEGAESAVDRLVEQVDKINDEIAAKAYEPRPLQPYEPPSMNPSSVGSQPMTARIPLYVDLSQGNVVTTVTSDSPVSITVGGAARTYTHTVSGAGGPAGSAVADEILTNSPLQYGTETLTGTAANDVIYADGFGTLASYGYSNTQATYSDLNTETGLPNTSSTHLYYAKELSLGLSGYIRSITSVTMSGLPDGVVAIVANGAKYSVVDGTVSIPPSAVIPIASPLTFIYDAASVPRGDVTIYVNIQGRGTGTINTTREFLFNFADVDSVTDITSTSGWNNIYTMETASAPHVIDAKEGHNLVYGGNSADTVTAGSGDDIIFTYAGNDTITAGNGNNTIWAGNGNDRVITGSGNDVVSLGTSSVAADAGDNYADVGNGNNTVTAGAGKDTIIAGTGNDVISAGDGDNVVSVAGGNNSVTTGSGADTITSGSGNDVINSGDGNDVLKGGGGSDVINAGSGTDFLSYDDGVTTAISIVMDSTGSGSVTTSSGVDTISSVENMAGSSGNDLINASAYAVSHTLYGLGGNDTLYGGSLSDSLSGGTGNDTLYGLAGNDLLSGGDGDDTIDGGSGEDIITAGAGNDRIVYSDNVSYNTDTVDGGDGTDILDLSALTDALTVDMTGTVKLSSNNNRLIEFNNIETLSLGAADDTVTLSSNSETVYLGNGSNVANAGGGVDTVYGGSGTDQFFTVAALGGTSIYYDGGAGSNYYTLGDVVENIVGGSGTDLISYRTSSAGIIVNLDASSFTWGGVTVAAGTGYGGSANGDTYSSVNYVIGTNYNDVMNGSTGNDTFTGGSGNDTIYGNDGNDRFSFYPGYSTAVYETGNDYFDGGSGSDDLYYVNNGTYYMYVNLDTISHSYSGINVAANTMILDGVSADYTVTVMNIENVYSGGYADVIFGSSDANTIYGNGGNDIIFGYGGNDKIRAGGGGTTAKGSDYMDGGDGIDIISYEDLSAGYNSTGIVASLTTGLATYKVSASSSTTDTLIGFEHLYGSPFADTLTGDANDNSLTGANGNDTLYGLAGNDYLSGGNDNDYLDGGAGNDTIWAGNGDDTLISGSGTNLLYGEGGNDTFIVSVSELATTTISGLTGTDTLTTANWDLSTNLNIATISSIESINAKGSTVLTTAALNYSKVQGIMDVNTGSTLTLYLDTGDTYTYTGSTAGTGTAMYTSAHVSTYAYTSGSNTLNVEVHWT